MPKSAIIGGSGTCVPELVLVEPLVLLDVDELVELEVDELVELDELLDVEVEVLEVMFPAVEVLVETLPDEDDVLVTLPEDDVLVTLPEDDVLETLPELVEVELPPVEVDDPPVEVDVELPLTFTTVPEEDPLVVLVVVELISTCPPPPEPPKKPPKKPPPNPPKPPEPPITTGVLPPPPLTKPPPVGIASGAIANCCSSTQTFSPSRSMSRLGASHSKVTTRWTRLILCGTTRRVFTYLTGFVVFTFLVDLVVRTSFAGASATWTAPPTASAPPAATADNFARAILTDMVVLSASTGFGLTAPQWPARLHPFTPRTDQFGRSATRLTTIQGLRSRFFGSIPPFMPALSHSGTETRPIPKRR